MIERDRLLQLLSEMWAERRPDNIFDSQRCINTVNAFEKAIVAWIVRGRKEEKEEYSIFG